MREARRDHEKIKEREKEESRMSLRELEDIGCDVELIVQLNELKNNLRIVMATARYLGRRAITVKQTR